jgi:hypothetical protein
MLWRIDLLLGRDLDANDGTAAAAVQRRGKHTSTTIELLLGKHVLVATVTHATGKRGVVYAVCAEKLQKEENWGDQFS